MTTVDVEEVLVIVVLLSGLSFYYAAVATETLALTTTVVAVAMTTTAVSGLSFFSYSAVADAAATVDVSKIDSLKEVTVQPSPLSLCNTPLNL